MVTMVTMVTYVSVRIAILLSGIKLKPGTCREILQKVQTSESVLHSPSIIEMQKSTQIQTCSYVFSMSLKKGYLCCLVCLPTVCKVKRKSITSAIDTRRIPSGCPQLYEPCSCNDRPGHPCNHYHSDNHLQVLNRYEPSLLQT